MPVVPLGVTRRGVFRPKISGNLHNRHPARRVWDTNPLVWRGSFVRAWSPYAKNSRVSLLKYASSMTNDMPPSMCHILTCFLLPIIRPAACNRIWLRILACSRTTSTRRRRLRLTSSAFQRNPRCCTSCRAVSVIQQALKETPQHLVLRRVRPSARLPRLRVLRVEPASLHSISSSVHSRVGIVKHGELKGPTRPAAGGADASVRVRKIPRGSRSARTVFYRCSSSKKCLFCLLSFEGWKRVRVRVRVRVLE